ncbi:MAG TPA: nucleotidyltransferase domain-containing protein [Candidatus Acetothermia bacterium]|nr:nucleotidyltransferase domain-containing protein [Candidatus Acetothermia bacterium]
MPSVIQKRSYNSVTVYSIDEQSIWAALKGFTTELTQRPEVLAVLVFGSLVNGQLGVGSDVDVLLILARSDRSFLDRPPVYSPGRFPVDMDIFPYTLAEVRAGQPIAQEALLHGRVLWSRTPLDSLLPGKEVGE